jgi:hypothetical protein
LSKKLAGPWVLHTISCSCFQATSDDSQKGEKRDAMEENMKRRKEILNYNCFALLTLWHLNHCFFPVI